MCSSVCLLSEFFALCPFPPSPSVGLGVYTLRMLGVNCCSLEGKWGRLVAYIVLHNTIFVCFQELWVDLDPARLVGLPYRLFSGVTFRGGGALVLVHLRRAGRAKIEVWRERHVLGVCVWPDSPEAVAVVFAHFPPKMDPEGRAHVCKEVVGFLECSGGIVQFPQGDLNATPRRAGGGGRSSKGSGPQRALGVLGVPLFPWFPYEHCAAAAGACVSRGNGPAASAQEHPGHCMSGANCCLGLVPTWRCWSISAPGRSFSSPRTRLLAVSTSPLRVGVTSPSPPLRACPCWNAMKSFLPCAGSLGWRVHKTLQYPYPGPLTTTCPLWAPKGGVVSAMLSLSPRPWVSPWGKQTGSR